jgi:hypothetical protein
MEDEGETTKRLEDSVSGEQQKKISELKETITEMANVLAETSKSSPYLIAFDKLIRQYTITKLKNICGEIFEAHDEEMKARIFDTQYINMLPHVVVQFCIEFVDPLFKSFSEQVEKKLIKDGESVNAEDFRRLNVSDRVKALVPKDPLKKSYVYDLFIRWILRYEITIDYFLRSETYGFTAESVSPQKVKEKNEKDLPSTRIYKGKLNHYLKKGLDKVIDTVYEKTVGKISGQINKAILGAILYGIFGMPAVSICGMVISLVEPKIDIPIIDMVMSPIVDSIKSKLNIGNQNICEFILLEAITQITETNENLEEMFKGIRDTKFSSAQHYQHLDNLNDIIKGILEDKKKPATVNIEELNDDSDNFVLVDAGNGFEAIMDVDECIEYQEHTDPETNHTYGIVSLEPPALNQNNGKTETVEEIGVVQFDEDAVEVDIGLKPSKTNLCYFK